MKAVSNLPYALVNPNSQVLEVAEQTVTAAGTAVVASVKVPYGCLVVVEAQFIARLTTGVVGYYKRTTVAKNLAGTTTLVGSEVAGDFENTGGWGVVGTADDTNDQIIYTATADGSINTIFEGLLSVSVYTLKS